MKPFSPRKRGYDRRQPEDDVKFPVEVTRQWSLRANSFAALKTTPARKPKNQP
jgi:hypothetical protein